MYKVLKGINPFIARNRNLFNYSNKYFKSSNSLQKKLSVGEAAVVLEQRISGISQVFWYLKIPFIREAIS